ncbi:MAG TPA: glutathione binding-like protein [Stellaceae bacterium]|jgi:glutathione S-transferase|nr:glutathione binding-like protein [Stellaceae bacterium]
MHLYFSPLACSMASRVALYEAGADAYYVYVDGATKTTEAGEDYLAINPLGLVPALRLDDGSVLTENSAILGYLADRFWPANAETRARRQQWIGFVNSELHTAAFSAILGARTSDEVRDHALDRAHARFAYLDKVLADRDYLAGDVSVADGYLFVVLNWTRVRGPDLADYPRLAAYRERLAARPNVARAFEEEMGLYLEEQRRRAA